MKTIEKTFYRIYDHEGDICAEFEDLQEAEASLEEDNSTAKFYNDPLYTLKTEIEDVEVEDEGRDPDDAYEAWRENQEFN